MQKPNPISVVGHHAKVMNAVYDRINNVLKKPLHPKQVQLAKDYFLHGKRIIMSQWGRSGGKTESALYIACVAAMLNDNFLVYIITPEKKQGREIYWASKRLQNYPPPEYVKEARETESRLVFNNGSFICIDGCENYNAHRGLKPNLVIYDEFQNHNREFHMEVMAPNLLAKQSALIIYGTPPKERSSFYVEFWEMLQKQIAGGDNTRVYYEFPTAVNPSIEQSELAKVRKELLESGNEVIWYREYEGKMVFGGEDVVFPKWAPHNHWRTHKVVMSYLQADRRKLKWYTVCDPATSSCFAVMFAVYNPLTQQIFIIDEIYEKDRKRMDSRQIWERIQAKQKELYPEATLKDWRVIYDEAAAWFANEISANYKIGLVPSMKQRSSEENDISSIKLLMAQNNALIVSDRCYWVRWEIESYTTDEYGRFRDTHNHLIDCFKYLMQNTGWRLVEKAENSSTPRVIEPRRENFDIVPESWAENAVEQSLWIPSYDLYREYFD